jgi:ornithine decarboxylase antizyme 1
LDGLRFTFSFKKNKSSLDGSYKFSVTGSGSGLGYDDVDDVSKSLDSVKRLEAVYSQDNLYLHIPSGIIPLEGSKEAFISMLEFAEDELKAKNVIISLAKDGQDKNGLLRLFRFLGFVLLPPNHSLATFGTDDLIFLAYNIA